MRYRRQSPPPFDRSIAPSRFRWVHVAAGLLLLTAAGLKLAGLNSASLVLDDPLDQPWVRMAAIEWEAALGLWLLSGAYSSAAWLFGVGTFAAFAAVGVYHGVAGYATCNCLGVVAANPWAMVGLDAAVVTALLFARPTGVIGLLTRRTVAVAVVVVLVGSGLFATATGTHLQDQFRGALFGSHATVAGDRVDFGAHAPGEIVTVEVEVRNPGGDAVAVVGGTNDCSVHVTGTPMIVPPHGSATISVGLKVPDRASGRYARQLELWTDSAAKPRVRLVAVYEVP